MYIYICIYRQWKSIAKKGSLKRSILPRKSEFIVHSRLTGMAPSCTDGFFNMMGHIPHGAQPDSQHDASQPTSCTDTFSSWDVYLRCWRKRSGLSAVDWNTKGLNSVSPYADALVWARWMHQCSNSAVRTFRNSDVLQLFLNNKCFQKMTCCNCSV